MDPKDPWLYNILFCTKEPDKTFFLNQAQHPKPSLAQNPVWLRQYLYWNVCLLVTAEPAHPQLRTSWRLQQRKEYMEVPDEPTK